MSYARVLAPLLLLTGLLAVPVSAQSGCSQSLQNLADTAPVGGTVLVPPCVYHETVYIGHAVTLDGQMRAIVDGDATRDRWFWIGSSDVTVKNFSLRNTNTPSQVGAIGTQAGIRNVTIDHNVMTDTRDGHPIGIGETTDSRVTNNDLAGGNAQMGIGTWRNTRLLIQGNHIHHNNQDRHVDPFWAAGGVKTNQDAGLQILNNEVDHNTGPGIWVDILATDVVIANNTVHDQAWNPIFFEVSSRGEIYGNTISASNQGADRGNWGCIVLSTVTDAHVHDNTCIDTLPLRAQLDNRPDVPPNAGHNNVLQNNRLLRPTPNQATSWWQFSPTGPLVPGTNGNVDSNNQIVTSLVPTPTATPLPKATVTPIPSPTLVCEMKVRIGGVEGAWKPCL